MNSATALLPPDTHTISSFDGHAAPADGIASKSPAQIAEELLGFAPACVGAALRFRSSGDFEDFSAMLPGMIAFHRPRGAARAPEVLRDELRLKEDIGLDSLALTEMAFKLDDLFGISIETSDVFGLETVGDLKALLKRRLDRP
jgi:acyl carrier protein